MGERKMNTPRWERVIMMGSNEEGNCLACDIPLINKSTWGYCNTCWNDRKIMKAVEWEKYWMRERESKR